MKKGSADDPFAEEPQDANDEELEDEEEKLEEEPEAGPSGATTGDSVSPDTVASAGSQTQSLPYIYARSSVKDGRQQRPIFLRDEVEDGIPDLVSDLEETFDKNVYRTDVLEAAVVVAQENPDLVEKVLGEWGYGWE
jgi:hypothetical protein